MTDMDKMMIDGQTLPCSLCSGSGRVRDNIDPLDYPETAPCPKCSDGEWAYRALMNRANPDDRLREALERVAELETQLNTPEVDDFAKGAVLEAAHQRSRWGADHDAGKTPFDWFWLVGYLAQKAAACAVAGDNEKALHHTISTAAALANWHLALSGADTRMRAGIGPGNGGDKTGSAYDLASKIDSALFPLPQGDTYEKQ